MARILMSRDASISLCSHIVCLARNSPTAADAVAKSLPLVPEPPTLADQVQSTAARLAQAS